MADTKIYSKGEKVIIIFLFIFAITALVLSSLAIHKSRNTTVNDSTTNNSNGGSNLPGSSSAEKNWTTDIAWASIFKAQLISCPMWNNAQGDSLKFPFPLLTTGGVQNCILPTSINIDKGLGDQPFVIETGTNDILDTKYNNLLMFTPKRTGCYKFTVNLTFDLAEQKTNTPNYTEYTKKQLVMLHLQPVENPTVETSLQISSCYPTLNSYGNGDYEQQSFLIANLQSNERYFNSTRIFNANVGNFFVGTKYCFSIHFQDLSSRDLGFLNLVDCNIKIEFWDVTSS